MKRTFIAAGLIALLFFAYSPGGLCVSPTPTGPTPFPVPTKTPTPPGGSTPTVTPAPPYLELKVKEKDAGGFDFRPGEEIVLDWRVNASLYGFQNVPSAVYLAAGKNPPDEDTMLSVAEILRSNPLLIFNSALAPIPYSLATLKPTYTGVAFPLPGGTTSSTLSFTVPEKAAGRWVFSGAIIRHDNDQFPSDPPVSVSNGFNIR